MSTEITKATATELAELRGMVDENDAGGAMRQIPVLKINYDPEAEIPRGAWVMGQQKDGRDGGIVEQGKLVKGLILYFMRYRWAYYDNKNLKNNCNSPFYLRGEQVRGSNYGYICGNSCPHRAEGASPRCRNQVVLFGAAVCEDKSLVDCMAYMSGASWKPASSYVETLAKDRARPLFAHLTALDAQKEKNAGTTYFIAQFKHAGYVPVPRVRELKARRDEALKYVDAKNQMEAAIMKKAAAPAEAPVTAMKPAALMDDIEPDWDAAPAAKPAGAGSTAKPAAVPTVPSAPEDDMPPWDVDEPAPAGLANAAPPAPDGLDDFDIESAIKSALTKAS